MGFMAHEIAIELAYTRDDCYNAAKEALVQVGFPLRSENETAGVLQANVKAKITSTTWGDVVTVTVSSMDNGMARVVVNSTAKAASLLAGRQQVKNVDAFTNALTSALEKYQKISSSAPAPANISAVEEIKQYKELLDIGAITQEEYEAKKKQILNL